MKTLRNIGSFMTALACALWLAPVAAAACSGTDTAALVGCINALEAKVDSLQGEVAALKVKADNPSTEQKLSALTAANAQLSARIAALADGGASSGDTVMAPFTVTNEAGYPIFKVESYRGGSGAMVTIGGNNEIQMSGSAGSGAKVLLGGNGGRIGTWMVTPQSARLSMGTFTSDTVAITDHGSNKGGSVAVMKTADTVAELVSTDKMLGVAIYRFGKERANLGIPANKDSAVRLFSTTGEQIAAMGPSSGGGVVYLGNGKKNGVTIVSDANSQGALSLFKGGDTPVVQLRGLDTSIGIFDDAGVPLGAMLKSTNSGGGNLTLMNSGGEGVVTGGGTTAGDGAFCVSRKKNGQTCLGIGLPMR